MKYVLILTVVTLLTGCTSRTISNTSPTAIERLLLSIAVDTAFDKISLPQLANAKAYLDYSNLQSYDPEYVKSIFWAHVAAIVEKPDEADYIIQVACGPLDNECKDTLLGIPPLPVPGSPMTLPDLAYGNMSNRSG